MDDPVFKQKYQKYKLRVKLWEKDFKKKYSRIPSKYDIRDAPKEIRDSYKMYYKLKTSFLEDTLSDVLSEDGFDVLENFPADMDESMQDASSCPQLPLDISNISNIELNSSTTSFSNLREIDSKSKLVNTVNLNEEHIIKEFEPDQVNEHNQKAWGSTVTKKPPPPTKKSPSPVKQFKSNLNAKLFKATSFSMRNPRKSLSRPNKDISQSQPTTIGMSESSVPVETLPDLETILTQRAKEIPVKEVNIDLMASIGFSKPEKMAPLQLDAGWLKRNIADDDEAFVKATQSIPAVPMGISNINVTEIEKAVKSQVVQKEEDVPEVPTSFGIHHDSDSVVSNSEDENDSQEYRHIAKRRRVLTTIDRNLQQDQIQVKQPEKKLPNIESAPDTIEKKVEENSSEEESKKPKKPRKKATAKSAKPTAKRTAKKEQPTKAAPRKLTRGRKKQVEEETLPPQEEETAPDIENVKYTLALETSKVASLPRANIDDLKQANSLADEYINKFHSKIEKKNMDVPHLNEKREAERGKLEAKIDSGKLNENFVRINLKKKVFVRGKKTVNYSRYKKKLWKEKKASALTGPDMDMGGCDGGVLTCFNCGQTGHFARQCKIKGDSLLPNTVEVEDESPFMTLEEAERLASQTAVAAHSRNLSKLPNAPNPLLCRVGDSDTSEDGVNESQEDLVQLPATPSEAPTYVGHKIPEDFLKKAGLIEGPTIVSETGPLYDLNPDGSTIPVSDEVREVLHLFGHTDFRKGQDRAIMRILSGLSTLVTLSTGSGKSLCYQLPAYLYSKQKHSITLVISPLVSLMEDQVHGVPHFLRAHCLHTNQTPQQKKQVLELINNGEVDILLVSPEAVVAGERSTGFGAILRKLPPIAFACIDEAHCVSQWSHNFRPSYLMICKVLQKNLGVKTVLGLTATATLPTRKSIIRHLGILDGEKGIISDVPLPDNLIISVSKDENKEAALIELLCSERFSSCQSIIIYCTRRDECEKVAAKLRTYMQDMKKPESEDNGKKKRKRVSWQAEPYHAGLPASRRRTIQKAFMSNELRIVVATIAFGMGINKPDIRSVIHYNMPKNFESYVQEIGRAGRDGKLSHCHLFLDSRGNDQNELRRHIYANSIDRHVIRKLLMKIFIPCSCHMNLKKSEFVKEHEDEIKASQDIDWDEDVFIHDNADKVDHKTEKDKRKRICPGHEIGFSIEETVQELDIPEENISTLLCYLELDGRWGINVLSTAYMKCKVISYTGPKYMKHAAKDCPPLAMAIAQQIKNKTFDEESNVIEFSVVDIAAAIGWNSGVVKHQLKNLEWVNENGYPKRSPLSVQLFNLGFRITAPGDFTLDEIDEALDTLYNRAVKQETTQLIQLQYVFQGLSSVAYKSYRPCASEDYPHERSDKLKTIIRDYFQNDYPANMVLEPVANSVPDDAIISDIHSLISMYPDNNFSGRNIARIFHGIQSPNFPAVIWGRCKFWRAHSKSDFNRIVKLGNSVIIKMRT